MRFNLQGGESSSLPAEAALEVYTTRPGEYQKAATAAGSSLPGGWLGQI